MSYTTDKNDSRLGHGIDENEIPQHEAYLVLSEEERAKGFIRPVRTTYVHAGRLVKSEGKVRELNEEEKVRYKDQNYFAFMEYPKSDSPIVGKFLFKDEFDNIGKRIGGCGCVTTMGLPLAETYARDPNFYGATYCSGCMKHLPVNEFLWDGTDEEVGS